MEPVVQKDSFGCSVACVASILEIPYERALYLFGPDAKRKAEESGFYCKDIVAALRHTGLNYEFKYIKSELRKRIYNDGVIVYIKRSKKYPVGHFLARKNGAWYDSWINFPDKNRRAGIRKRLPEKTIYLIEPIKF